MGRCDLFYLASYVTGLTIRTDRMPVLDETKLGHGFDFGAGGLGDVGNLGRCSPPASRARGGGCTCGNDADVNRGFCSQRAHRRAMFHVEHPGAGGGSAATQREPG